jgi:hypothetical protein
MKEPELAETLQDLVVLSEGVVMSDNYKGIRRRDVLSGLATGAFLLTAGDFAGACVTPTPTSEARTWIGTGRRATSLGNTIIRTVKVGWKFKAEESGYITGVRPYIRINRPKDTAYSGGTGGTCRLAIYSMVNGLPASRISPYVSYRPGTYENPGTQSGFPHAQTPFLSFDPPVSVTAGARYYVVIDNTDPNPSTNFFSTNCLHQSNVTSESMQRNPCIANLDEGEILFSSNTWSTSRPHKSPIMNVFYQSGLVQGNGFTEVILPGLAGSLDGKITSSQHIRQVFVSPVTQNATAVNVACRLVSGSGEIIAELKDGSGSLLASAKWAHTEVPTSFTGWLPQRNLSSGVSLVSGQTYRLSFRVFGSGVMLTHCLRNGAVADNDYGFDIKTTIRGRAEYSTDNGYTWRGYKVYGVDNSSRACCMYYLMVV